MENDPAFRAAGFEVKAVEQTVKQARGRYLPDLRIRAQHTETDQEILSSENEIFGQGTSSFPTDEYGLRFSQPILNIGHIARLRQSKANLNESQSRYAAAEQGLMMRSAEAYLGVLLAKHNLDLALAEQRAYEQQLAQVTRRQEVGLANVTELYETRARFAFSGSEVITAENTLDDSYEALAEIIGDEARPELSPLLEEFPLEPPSPGVATAWIDAALGNNPEIRAREHAVAASEQEIRRQRADRYPSVDLVVDHASRTTEGSLFGGGSEVDTTEIMVMADVPLFQGGQVRARRKEAEFRHQQLLEEQDRERRFIKRRTREAFLSVIGGISRVSALKSTVEAQRLTVESKERGFQAGTNTNLEILDAQRDLFLAQRDYARSRHEYILDSLRLNSYAGELDTEDLAYLDNMVLVKE